MTYYFLFYIYFSVCVCMCAYGCRGQRTICVSLSSPSIMCSSRSELRSPGLAWSHFILWDILLVFSSYFQAIPVLVCHCSALGEPPEAPQDVAELCTHREGSRLTQQPLSKHPLPVSNMIWGSWWSCTQLPSYSWGGGLDSRHNAPSRRWVKGVCNTSLLLASPG